MKNYTFANAQGSQLNSFAAALVANAAAATIATFDVRNLSVLSTTVKVAGAPLTSLEAFARTDLNADFMPIPRSEFIGYGRNDSSTDIGTTPVGAACAIRMDVTSWSEVRLVASSAGAATTTTTAGVEAIK